MSDFLRRYWKVCSMGVALALAGCGDPPARRQDSVTLNVTLSNKPAIDSAALAHITCKDTTRRPVAVRLASGATRVTCQPR